MAEVTYSNQRTGCYLGQCAGPNIVNEEIIMSSGSGVVLPGTVLGQVTATEEYKPLDLDATDGTEEAAGILFGNGKGFDAGQVDATSADVKCVATVNGPATINENLLIYPDGATADNIDAINKALRLKGMKVLPQHAG